MDSYSVNELVVPVSFLCPLRGGVEGPAGTANAIPLFIVVRRCRTTFSSVTHTPPWPHVLLVECHALGRAQQAL